MLTGTGRIESVKSGNFSLPLPPPPQQKYTKNLYDDWK